MRGRDGLATYPLRGHIRRPDLVRRHLELAERLWNRQHPTIMLGLDKSHPQYIENTWSYEHAPHLFWWGFMSGTLDMAKRYIERPKTAGAMQANLNHFMIDQLVRQALIYERGRIWRTAVEFWNWENDKAWRLMFGTGRTAKMLREVERFL